MPSPTPEQAMQNPSSVMQPSTSDVAVDILDKVFGHGWQKLYMGESSTDAANAIFGMLQAFNMVVLAGAALMFFYIIGTGIIGTAHEGQPLGKKHNTIWTPIRSAFGISLLMPIPGAKGLSLIQAVVLAFAYWGIGGADFIWNKGVDHLAKNAGQITPLSPQDNPENLARGALLAQVIRHYRTIHMDYPSSTVVSEWQPRSAADRRVEHSRGGSGGHMLIKIEPPAEAIEDGVQARDYGGFRVPCKNADSPICQARTNGIVQLMQDMTRPAEKIVGSFAGAESAHSLASGRLKSETYRNAVTRYDEALTLAIREQLAEFGERYQKQLQQDFAPLAKEKGFAFAGAWYWTIAKYNKKAGEVIVGTPSFVEPNYDALTDLGSSDLDAFKSVASTYVNVEHAKLQRVARGHHEKDGLWGKFASFINRPFSGFDPIGFLGLDDDPILALQGVGNKIIAACMTTAAGIVGAKMSAAAGKGASDGILATITPFFSGGSKAATSAIMQLLKDVSFVAIIFIVPLFILGMTLAYYLPAIPFIIFTSAFIGWIILLLESIVAAPLWAASHIDGSDEGITGQRGKTGYMLFLGVLMRPALMIIGFFLSFMIISSLGEFLHTAFSTFSSGLRAGFGPSGLATFTGLTIIIGSITIIFAHKLFGLVSWLPDNVLKWIGQQVQNLGEKDDVAQAKTHFAAGAGFVYNQGSDAIKPTAGQGQSKQQAKAGSSAASQSEKDTGGVAADRDLEQGEVGSEKEDDTDQGGKL